jgi:chromosome partitioning protein
MHKIMVLNAKGGCGKTTIATTLACYFASNGYSTALMDFDPQQSSNRWLKIRSPEQPQIKIIDGARSKAGVTRSWQLYGGNETEIVVIDTPAGVTGGKLVELFHKADSILIPVMPSIIDLHAMEVFLVELGRLLKQGQHRKHVGVIANRVRMKGKSYYAIEELMEEVGLPLVSVLRDTQNYSIAMESGLGISELKSGTSAKDRKHWDPILDWLLQMIPSKQQKLDLSNSPPGRWPSAVA